MRAALRLSVSRAGLSPTVALESDRFLASLPVPVPRRIEPKRLVELARQDKKARGGKARFVLLRALGRPTTMFVDDEIVLRVVRELL
jgi:3-dehydroquinate synthetase